MNINVGNIQCSQPIKALRLLNYPPPLPLAAYVPTIRLLRTSYYSFIRLSDCRQGSPRWFQTKRRIPGFVKARSENRIGACYQIKLALYASLSGACSLLHLSRK